MVVSFLGTEYRVEIHPQTDIGKVDSGEEVSIPDKILIAHYLLGAAPGKNLPENSSLFARFRMVIFILKHSRGGPEIRS